MGNKQTKIKIKTKIVDRLERIRDKIWGRPYGHRDEEFWSKVVEHTREDVSWNPDFWRTFEKEDFIKLKVPSKTKSQHIKNSKRKSQHVKNSNNLLEEVSPRDANCPVMEIRNQKEIQEARDAQDKKDEKLKHRFSPFRNSRPYRPGYNSEEHYNNLIERTSRITGVPTAVETAEDLASTQENLFKLLYFTPDFAREVQLVKIILKWRQEMYSKDIEYMCEQTLWLFMEEFGADLWPAEIEGRKHLLPEHQDPEDGFVYVRDRLKPPRPEFKEWVSNLYSESCIFESTVTTDMFLRLLWFFEAAKHDIWPLAWDGDLFHHKNPGCLERLMAGFLGKEPLKEYPEFRFLQWQSMQRGLNGESEDDEPIRSRGLPAGPSDFWKRIKALREGWPEPGCHEEVVGRV